MEEETNIYGNAKAINYCDLVIIYETGDSIKYFTLEKGKKFQNKFGVFLHDDIYGKNYGCKIYDTKEKKNIFLYYLLFLISWNVVRIKWLKFYLIQIFL